MKAIDDRELKCIKAYCEEGTAKAAASRLKMHPKTVEYWLTRARKELGLNNSMQLIQYAFRSGLVSLLMATAFAAPPMPRATPVAKPVTVVNTNVTVSWTGPLGFWAPNYVSGFQVNWGLNPAIKTNVVFTTNFSTKVVVPLGKTNWFSVTTVYTNALTGTGSACCTPDVPFYAPTRRVKVAANLEGSTDLATWFTLTNYPDFSVDDPQGNLNFRSKLTVQ